ncbi:hypothetical protein CLI70_10555 [Prevotella intermedia]|nr:hypothetical protein CLI70_10555 [Prevotella intermedia]
MKCVDFFLQVPDIFSLFPAALRYGICAILLQAEACDDAQNEKGITNKITIRLWDILSLRTQIGRG